MFHWSENANTLFSRLHFDAYAPRSSFPRFFLLDEPLLFLRRILSFLYQARANIFSQSMNSASFCHCRSFNCCPLRRAYRHRYLFPLTNRKSWWEHTQQPSLASLSTRLDVVKVLILKAALVYCFRQKLQQINYVQVEYYPWTCSMRLLIFVILMKTFPLSSQILLFY